MQLFNLGLYAVFLLALAIMLDQNRLALARIVASIPARGQQLSVLDILTVYKVPERAAGQAIRRAQRLGYKELMHMNDESGTVYIVFQLCPARSQLMPFKSEETK